MVEGGLVRATDVLANVALRVEEALSARQQHLLLDADPEAWLAPSSGVRAQLVDLVRFASARAPRGCELLLAAARPAGRVSVAGAGRIVLRWQVALDADSAPSRENVIPLRAAPDTPEALLAAPEVRALVRRCAEAGGSLAFDVLGKGNEIRATLAVPAD